ncbi:Endoribonuclease Dicer-like 2b [Symbiodinium microadriaticum]|uniref:Endoribonuclease Dicer-like 2b n=1 Tax=Symbiodinium microadriaticum TaxID=2951 RepID=A0A1Q9EYP0_SYMMI|nr:Endoribonuclease Dicer-like 2b [Symbiodinium microadriaticum]
MISDGEATIITDPPQIRSLMANSTGMIDGGSGLTLRGYQSASVQRAVGQNVIISLPTNYGKTLIAAKVIDHVLSNQNTREKHVLFIVPTKALVNQQAKYCRNHCDQKPAVDELCGMEMEKWDEVKWTACLRQHQVLVGTPEIFRRAMDQGFLQVAQLSLLVFDECHRAKGNHPMAAIMADFVQHAPESQRPRILGLTASFFDGAMKNRKQVEKHRLELELRLLSSIYSPDLPEDAASPAGSRDGSQKTWTRVSWSPDPEAAACAAAFEEQVSHGLGKIKDELGNAAESKDFKKMGYRMQHVLLQMGRNGLQDYVQKCIVKQFERNITELLELQKLSEEHRQQMTELLGKLGVLEKCLQVLEPDMMQMPSVKRSPQVSSKLLKLQALLQEEPRKSGKGIIFVQQVALTVPLAMALNRDAGQTIAEALYGQMTKQDTDRTMLKLREGQIKVVVSTNSLEEGIDVCDCNWVVRYDRFSTTRAHIQGSGRARSQQAEIIYFENDPDEEASKATVMANVAKDDRLKLNDDESTMARKTCGGHHVTSASPQSSMLRERLHGPSGCIGGNRRKTAVPGVYPFDNDGQGQRIDFFNCQTIVMDWCQQVLKEAFRSEGLFPNYGGSEMDASRPAVRVPTPDGFQVIASEEIDEHWKGVSLQQVIDKERLDNFSKADRAKRRSLYVAACILRRRGYLDDRNIANVKATELAAAKCREGPPPKKLRFTGSFARSVEPKAGNYKGALQEFLQQLSPHAKMQDLLEYKSVMDDQGWRVTVQVTTPPEIATSDNFANKKAAEQDAAKKVLERLRQHQTPCT